MGKQNDKCQVFESYGFFACLDSKQIDDPYASGNQQKTPTNFKGLTLFKIDYTKAELINESEAYPLSCVKLADDKQEQFSQTFSFIQVSNDQMVLHGQNSRGKLFCIFGDLSLLNSSTSEKNASYCFVKAYTSAHVNLFFNEN